MSEIVQKFVAQTPALMCAWDESGYVEKLDGHRAAAVNTRSVVGFAFILHTEALACACYLEVSDGSLGIDGGETS